MKTIAAAAMLGASLCVSPPPDTAPETQGEAHDPVAVLSAGNSRFVSGHPLHSNSSPQRRGEVATGQHPFAVVIGCADSRVPPELVFDQGIGDLFVIRVAGNVLGDPGIASVEYAVEHLGCELVVVLGHERCGAVDAALKGGKLPGHLMSLAKPIAPAVEEAARRAGSGTSGNLLDDAVRANIRRVVREVASCEPILAGHVKAGKARVVGARYDLDTGAVEFFPEPAAPRKTAAAEEAPAH